MARDPDDDLLRCRIAATLRSRAQVEPDAGRRVACLDQAEAILLQVMAKQPRPAAAHCELGDLLSGRAQDAGPKDLFEALAHYHRAHRLATHDTSIIMRLAKTCCDLGLYANAVRWVRKAIRLDSGAPLGRYFLGRVLAELGSHERAEARFRDELAAGTDDVKVRLRIVEALMMQGRVTEALGDVEAIEDDTASEDRFLEVRALLHHHHAVLLGLLDREPAVPLRGLSESLARQAGRPIRWSWVSFDRWLAGARLPQETRALVASVNRELRTQGPQAPPPGLRDSAGHLLRGGLVPEAIAEVWLHWRRTILGPEKTIESLDSLV